jgi:hydrogenase expression/formation protein HypC
MCLAVPGQLMSVSDAPELERTGRVSFGGVIREVSLAFVPESKPGDWVVVHVGFALERLDEEEALKTLDLLRQVSSNSSEADETP